jgi:hypothetical protein
MNRDQHFDKLVASYFDNLWSNKAYLETMGQLMKGQFALRQQWNKNVEQLLSFWQLPNQQMQQRTLHQINTLLSEWRFEQEELVSRLERIEQELASLKQVPEAKESHSTKDNHAAKGGKQHVRNAESPKAE